MQLKIFRLPAIGDTVAEDLINKFLRSHRILRVEKQFIPDGVNSQWCFCVEYLEGSDPLPRSGKRAKKVDYREIRKSLTASEGIPPYVIFTDKEIAAMAEVEKLSLVNLRSIKGIGEKKIAKYAAHFIIADKDETKR